MSSEVEKMYTIRKPIYDFLFDFYGQHLSFSYRFRDIRLQHFYGLTLTLDLWPLKVICGPKKIIPFESPYMTSYSTSMDNISLSRTVSEIFDFKVSRVRPWPLTHKSHLGSKSFIPFESPYMTSYLTSIDTISLSRTVLEIMPVKILKAEQNGGFWPFKGQNHVSIFFFYRKNTSSHQTASFEILRIKIALAV